MYGSCRVPGVQSSAGAGAYKAVTLVSDVYGIYGLRLRPEVQRLWYWTRPDFFRKVSKTSRPLMALNIAGWGLTASVAVNLLTIDPGEK
ncbi:DUF4225 domain-containing protein [Cronobacter dublinensis]|uniref:DUF4225 domain-containing protein n=1 Tax=Cronobacter dublinensis TaxID=413497 RepID=UPI00374CAA7E